MSSCAASADVCMRRPVFVKGPPSFCPALSVSLSLLCCVYECGVVCLRVLSHLHCVRGACGAMYVVLCVHVVLCPPAALTCSTLLLSCVVFFAVSFSV